MPGDWMSVSITPTRAPWRATATARLAVTLDLPVPPRNEWTDTIFATLPLVYLGLRPPPVGAPPDSARAGTPPGSVRPARVAQPGPRTLTRHLRGLYS